MGRVTKKAKVLSLARIVLEEMQRQGMTQRELAHLAKVDRTVLGRWLNDKRGYTVKNIERVLAVLGLQVIPGKD